MLVWNGLYDYIQCPFTSWAGWEVEVTRGSGNYVADVSGYEDSTTTSTSTTSRSFTVPS